MEKKKTIKGCLCAIFCEILFGLSYLFTKHATTSVDSLTLLSWRFATAFLVINLCVALGVVKISLRGKRLLPLFWIAVFQPVIYFVGETVHQPDHCLGKRRGSLRHTGSDPDSRGTDSKGKAHEAAGCRSVHHHGWGDGLCPLQGDGGLL